MISAQMTNRPLPILRCSFLFDSLDLINQVIGHACVPRAFGLARQTFRLHAVKQIQIRHRVVIILSKRNRFLNVLHAFINCGFKFPRKIHSKTLWRRFNLFESLIRGVFIKFRAFFAVGSKHHRPINNANPIIWLRVLRTYLYVPLMKRLRLQEHLRFIWRSRHLEQQRSQTINRAEVCWIEYKDSTEFLNGLSSILKILFAWCAGNILRGVGRCQVQPRIQQLRVHLFRVLESARSLFVSPALKCLDSAVQFRARLYLCVGLNPRWRSLLGYLCRSCSHRDRKTYSDHAAQTFHCNPQSSLREVILRLANQNRNTRIAKFFQWNEFRGFVD